MIFIPLNNCHCLLRTINKTDNKTDRHFNAKNAPFLS